MTEESASPTRMQSDATLRAELLASTKVRPAVSQRLNFLDPLTQPSRILRFAWLLYPSFLPPQRPNACFSDLVDCAPTSQDGLCATVLELVREEALDEQHVRFVTACLPRNGRESTHRFCNSRC